MKKILIVIDVQNDFIIGPLGTPEAKKALPNIIEKIKEYDKRGDIIFFTMDSHDDNPYKNIEERTYPTHCKVFTHGWNFHESIKKLLDYQMTTTNHYVYTKHSFAVTDFPDIIKKYIKKDENSASISIEIIGFTTDICVISNALLLRSFFLNTPITIDGSCTAGTTPEMHKKALEIMKANCIEII